MLRTSPFPLCFDASATRYSGSKYVDVLPVVIAELKLRDVQRQMLFAHSVERSHDAALEQRPKAVNRLSVHAADHILASGMPDEFVGKFSAEFPIAASVVRCEQTDFVRYGFADEVFQCFGISVFDDTRYDVAFTLHRADDGRFAGAGTTRLSVAALIPMFVASFSADVGFIDLDDATQLVGPVLTEASADTVAHIERGFVGAEAHVAHDLQRANALLAGQHQMNDLEPVAKRLVCVFEDRPDQNREAVAALLSAFGALPVKGPIGDRVYVNVSTTGTVNATRPTSGLQVMLAGFLVGKYRVELAIRKLLDRLNFGHDGLLQPMEAA